MESGEMEQGSGLAVFAVARHIALVFLNFNI